MALDFPSNPYLGQEVAGIRGQIWRWDLVKWVACRPQNPPLMGVTDGSLAGAGVIGEFRSTGNPTSTVINANTVTNILTLDLTPGDWDVTGWANASPPSLSGANLNIAISTTSASFPQLSGVNGSQAGIQMNTAGAIGGYIAGLARATINVSIATPVYFVASGDVSVRVYASMSARRMR